MRKVALTILGALLIAGSAGQGASASEHHARRAPPVYAPVYDQNSLDFRGAYNGPVYESLGERNRENFGVSGWDPSRVGDYDPSLRPSGS
jgi:hypothetical protein